MTGRGYNSPPPGMLSCDGLWKILVECLRIFVANVPLAFGLYLFPLIFFFKIV